VCSSDLVMTKLGIGDDVTKVPAAASQEAIAKGEKLTTSRRQAKE
jgi:hypothetical protein